MRQAGLQARKLAAEASLFPSWSIAGLCKFLCGDPDAQASGWALGLPQAQRASQYCPVILSSQQQNHLSLYELPVSPQPSPARAEGVSFTRGCYDHQASSGPFLSLSFPIG